MSWVILSCGLWFLDKLLATQSSAKQSHSQQPRSPSQRVRGRNRQDKGNLQPLPTSAVGLCRLLWLRALHVKNERAVPVGRCPTSRSVLIDQKPWSCIHSFHKQLTLVRYEPSWSSYAVSLKRRETENITIHQITIKAHASKCSVVSLQTSPGLGLKGRKLLLLFPSCDYL